MVRSESKRSPLIVLNALIRLYFMRLLNISFIMEFPALFKLYNQSPPSSAHPETQKGWLGDNVLKQVD